MLSALSLPATEAHATPCAMPRRGRQGESEAGKMALLPWGVSALGCGGPWSRGECVTTHAAASELEMLGVEFWPRY